MIDEVKVYLKSKVPLSFEKINFFGTKELYIAFGDYDEIYEFINKNSAKISAYHFDFCCKNSLMPLSDLSKYNARIEPGAIIRDKVMIEDGAVVLMGAVINCNVQIGSLTMVDMNAVIGSGVQIGRRCHIGAGAVIAGMMEPKATQPVVIEDDVFIGANAVVLEGVHIYSKAIIGAGAVVIKDVFANQTVVGVPARVIKENNLGWEFNQSLR